MSVEKGLLSRPSADLRTGSEMIMCRTVRDTRHSLLSLCLRSSQVLRKVKLRTLEPFPPSSSSCGGCLQGLPQQIICLHLTLTHGFFSGYTNPSLVGSSSVHSPLHKPSQPCLSRCSSEALMTSFAPMIQSFKGFVPDDATLNVKVKVATITWWLCYVLSFG